MDFWPRWQRRKAEHMMIPYPFFRKAFSLAKKTLVRNRLLRESSGNVLFLTAAALVPVLAMVGGSIDIGRSYMAKNRLQQACDAGVLAGRRAMDGSAYNSVARGQADAVFKYNYASDLYGSTTVNFTTELQNGVEVVGNASVKLPTTLMYVFGYDELEFSASCSAILEVKNTDIMMVLDVTGSMGTRNPGDSEQRIDVLKEASVSFFDKVTATEGEVELRFGVVPYNSSVNVGKILYEADPSWLSDTVILSSRTPIFRVSPKQDVGADRLLGTWETISRDGKVSSKCTGQGGPSKPAETSILSSIGEPDANRTARYIDNNGANTSLFFNSGPHYSYQYNYKWSGGQCQLQRRKIKYTPRDPISVFPNVSFANYYVYGDRVFDTTVAKTGAAFMADTGALGVSVSSVWDGCIIERVTTAFDDDETAPSEALDMDIDLVPTDDDGTKWKVLLADVSYWRTKNPFNYQPSLNTRNVSSQEQLFNGGLKYWRKFGDKVRGTYACPAAAMKMTTFTKDDRAQFQTYIDTLTPEGNTYHDAGMVWGARLMSPDGLFASENGESSNGQPINRNLIFMTDGELNTRVNILSYQGYEGVRRRTGATNDSDSDDIHNNRFLQLCEKVKAKAITLWVIGFGVELNEELNTCASPNRAFAAQNAVELNEVFEKIARNVSKLRLKQ